MRLAALLVCALSSSAFAGPRYKGSLEVKSPLTVNDKNGHTRGIAAGTYEASVQTTSLYEENIKIKVSGSVVEARIRGIASGTPFKPETILGGDVGQAFNVRLDLVQDVVNPSKTHVEQCEKRLTGSHQCDTSDCWSDDDGFHCRQTTCYDYEYGTQTQADGGPNAKLTQTLTLAFLNPNSGDALATFKATTVGKAKSNYIFPVSPCL
ncbi:MAG: hypothetical protein ACHQ49_16070 [Elusimicrobiota bacterium]